MTEINFDEYSVEELHELKGQIEQAIEERRERDVQQTVNQIQSFADSLGLSVEDLLTLAAKRKTPKSAAKFRNPNNPNQTWTGRGKRPNWFKELLDQGVPQDSLRIEEEA